MKPNARKRRANRKALGHEIRKHLLRAMDEEPKVDDEEGDSEVS